MTCMWLLSSKGDNSHIIKKNKNKNVFWKETDCESKSQTCS